MMYKRIIPVLISIVALLVVLAVSRVNEKTAEPVSSINISTQDTTAHTKPTEKNDNSPNKSKSKNDDFIKGVWISYMELDMQNENDKSESSFRKKFQKIADTSKNDGFNTLIVQVRPFSDALYNSKYFPYSHILTGTQGKNPKYDALKIMCEICRKKELKIEAWVNPYRIKSDETPNTLTDSNPYIKDSSLGKVTKDGIFYDPSNKKVQELIINGVCEIAKNYDVDGIQFDDYFYPTQDESFDKEEYEEYSKSLSNMGKMSLDNWRTANVNMLICSVYRQLKKTNPNIVFGISPQGNLLNNEKIYADVKSWCCCKGFVDYLCPQLYFSLENPALTFEDALKSYTSLDFDKNVSLMIGLGGYKGGSDADDGTWENNDDILATEYKIIRENKNIKGMMLYSYSSLKSNISEKEIKNLVKELN